MIKRSIIEKYFSKDLYLDLYRVSLMPNIDNNMKCSYVKALLKDYDIPFTPLGPGTNRMAVLIEGYAVKIALDKDGMIDNRREMLYTKPLQPYVIKVYECVPNGLIAVSEYVTFFESDDFERYRGEMADILEKVGQAYLIGDVGITRKNYVNWGIRRDGTKQICMLDFAYIYSVKYNIFRCDCDEMGILGYDNAFVNLICPKCGKKYEFRDLRRKISRQQQEDEIGDIKRLSYNLTLPEQDVIVVEEFEPSKKKKNQHKNDKKLSLKQLRKLHREREEDSSKEDYWDNEPVILNKEDESDE